MQRPDGGTSNSSLQEIHMNIIVEIKMKTSSLSKHLFLSKVYNSVTEVSTCNQCAPKITACEY